MSLYWLGVKYSSVLLQVDPDKAFAVSIQHDETVVQGPVAYMQCALLYTSSSGERRIRCGPRALPNVVRRAYCLLYDWLMCVAHMPCSTSPCCFGTWHASAWEACAAPFLPAFLVWRFTPDLYSRCWLVASGGTALAISVQHGCG